MKKRIRTVMGLAALVTIVGCAPRGMIHVSEVDPLFGAIRERHDAYVEQDDRLSNEEQAIYLRSTEIFQSTLDEAKGTPDGE